jgi:thiol-disulfide isomerase/thioredoxin
MRHLPVIHQIFITVCLACFFSFETQAQSVNHITIEELQKMYYQENDTTYVVNFWATWCGPCVIEMPVLQQFYESHKDSKTKLLLVSLDKPKYEKQLRNFVSKNKISAPVYMLDAGEGFSWLPQIDQRWEGSIPATLVVNASKKIQHFYETPLQPGQLEYLLNKAGLE